VLYKVPSNLNHSTNASVSCVTNEFIAVYTFQLLPEKIVVNIFYSKICCFTTWSEVYLLTKQHVNGRNLMDEFFISYGL